MEDKAATVRRSPIRKPDTSALKTSEKENARKQLVANPVDICTVVKASRSHSTSSSSLKDKDGKEKRERTTSNGSSKPPQKQKRIEREAKRGSERVVPSGYIENDAVYPETMASFLDGIKTDFETVIGTMYSTAFSFWSDEANGNNGGNNGNKHVATRKSSTTKREGAGGKREKLKKKWQADSDVALAQQNDALTMRLPSLWSNRASTSAALAEAIRSKDSSLPPHPSDSSSAPLARPTGLSLTRPDAMRGGRQDDGNDSSSVSSDKGRGSKKSRGSKGPIRVKQGDIVNLGILGSKTSLVSFECYDSHILIIGSRRMIMTQIIDKDNRHLYDLDGDFDIASGDMARVVWSQNLVDVDSCTISFANTDSTRFNAQLDLIVSNGKKTNLTVILPDAGMCSEVLQAIQQKKVGKPYIPSDKALLFKRTGAADPGAGPVSAPPGQASAGKGGIMMSPIRPLGGAADGSGAKVVRSSPKPGAIFNTSIAASGAPQREEEREQREAREAREEGTGKRAEASGITGTPGEKPGDKCTTPGVTSSATLTPLLHPTATPTLSHGTPEEAEIIALTPLTYTKVDICVRQMKHGVGHYGVRSKLVSDGVEESRATSIIESATRVLQGAKLGLIPGSRRVQLIGDDDKDDGDASAAMDGNDGNTTAGDGHDYGGSATTSNDEGSSTAGNGKHDGLGLGGLIGAVDLLTARRGPSPRSPRRSSPISAPGMDLGAELVQERATVSPLTTAAEEGGAEGVRPPRPPATFLEEMMARRNGSAGNGGDSTGGNTGSGSWHQGGAGAALPPPAFPEEMMRRRTSNADGAGEGSGDGGSDCAKPPQNFLEEMKRRNTTATTTTTTTAAAAATATATATAASNDSSHNNNDDDKGSASPVPAAALATPPPPAKYAKMLRMGIPRQGVVNKMLADGVCADPGEAERILSAASRGSASTTTTTTSQGADGGSGSSASPSTSATGKSEAETSERDAASESSSSESTASASEGGVAYKDHPKYAKYFKMLKMGLPKQAVINKMLQEGCQDAHILDHDPNRVVSEEKENGGGASVALKDHPKYAKYFKMLKMGLPKQAVTNKMLQEGVPTSILDRDPDEPVSIGSGNPADLKVTVNFKQAEKPKRKERKKKLHWDGIDGDAVSAESLWYEEEEEEDGIAIDDEEFKSLFVEVIKTPVKKCQKGGKVDKQKEAEKENRKVALVEGRRSQNAEIALSRLRGLTVVEIRRKVEAMDDSTFSCDQLENLIAYLPTVEEARALRAYTGDPQLLGPVEKFMLEMLRCERAEQRLRNMVFKTTVGTRVSEVRASLGLIERACDDVKMSLRLKKVMKCILKVGNQLNHNGSSGDGSNKAAGFRLDSLARLKTAKAFDKKTSVLQYVIMLIHRSDEGVLQWYEDMANVQAASRCGLEDAMGEVDRITEALTAATASTAALTTLDTSPGGCAAGKEADSLFAEYRAFLTGAATDIAATTSLKTLVLSKYGSVVEYFGEDPGLPSLTLFSMLQAFSQDFKDAQHSHTRAVKAQKKAEEREAAKAMKDESSGAAGGTVTSSSQSEKAGGGANRGRRATATNHHQEGAEKGREGESGSRESQSPRGDSSTFDIVAAIAGSASGKNKAHRRASIL